MGTDTETTKSSNGESNDSVKNCNTPVEYSIIRQEKLKKITDYYNTLLNEYTKVYTDYATQNSSVNSNDRTYADTALKPKTEAYNNQIIKLSKELIDAVNKDNDLIVDQTNDLDSKSKSIDTLMSDIKLLKDKNINEDILEKSQSESLNTTKSGTDDLHFTTQIYIGINILLVLIIIGLIIYLVYTNFDTNKNKNTNASINNIYKNIKVNSNT